MNSLNSLIPIALSLGFFTPLAHAQANANFADATLLTLPFSATGVDHTAATAELDEPDHGSPALDSVICIYTGTSLPGLTLIFETNNGGAAFDETYTTQVTGGIDYFIAVDSRSRTTTPQATSTFDLNLMNLDPVLTTIVTPEVMGFTIDPASGEFTIGFASKPGQNYSLNASPDLMD